MNRLKSLVAAVTLIFALAVSAAGETPACIPGETHTPPCQTLVAPEDPVVSGATSTLPEAESVEIVSLVDLVLYALLLA